MQLKEPLFLFINQQAQVACWLKKPLDRGPAGLTSHPTSSIPISKLSSCLSSITKATEVGLKLTAKALPPFHRPAPLALGWHIPHLTPWLPSFPHTLPTAVHGVDAHTDQGCLWSLLFSRFLMSAASLGSGYRRLTLRMKPCKRLLWRRLAEVKGKMGLVFTKTGQAEVEIPKEKDAKTLYCF